MIEYPANYRDIRWILLYFAWFEFRTPIQYQPSMIALALEAKADLVELDYHHSSDGVPIVIHDGTFDRTTNSRSIFKRKNIKSPCLPTFRGGKYPFYL